MYIKRHYASGAGAAAAVAAIANATNASGAIVKLEPAEFQKILNRAESVVVVHAMGGIFKKNYQYLLSYKGLFFFTKAEAPLTFGHKVELVTANKIWIPNMGFGS